MTEVNLVEQDSKTVFDMLYEKLPWHMRGTMFWPRAEKVFRRACECGYITVSAHGGMLWTYGDGNKTSLGYLIGRLYCGDSPHGGLWKKGGKHLDFPSRDVCRVFGDGMRNLASLRANRTSLPRDHGDIDFLFG